MSTSATEINSVENLDGVIDDTDLDTFSSDFFGEEKEEDANAKAPDAKDKADDAPEENDDTHVEDENLADEDKEDKEEDETPPKPKSRSEKRIEELNAKFRQEQREKQELLKRLEALEQAQPKNTPPKPTSDDAEGGPKSDELNEDGTDKYPLGDFDPAYIRDLTRYTLKAEREAANAETQKSVEQARIEEAQQALASDWNAKLPAAQEKYEDFMEKGQELIEDLADIDPRYGSYLTETLMSMEYGTDVLYHLATHPDEARDIVDSGARLATIKLGRLEAKFAAGKVDSEQRRVSNAPPPPPANKGSAVARVTVRDDTDDLAAFEKKFFKA